MDLRYHVKHLGHSPLGCDLPGEEAERGMEPLNCRQCGRDRKSVNPGPRLKPPCISDVIDDGPIDSLESYTKGWDLRDPKRILL